MFFNISNIKIIVFKLEKHQISNNKQQQQQQNKDENRNKTDHEHQT